MNGDFYPWSQGPSGQADYISATRRWVDGFRAVSSSFRFSFCANLTDIDVPGGHFEPELSYPDDAYVDAIEGDYYFRNSTDSTASELWGYITEVADRGLPWLVSFAAA